MPFEGHQYPQVLPTPRHRAPGRPAPWSGIDAGALRSLSLARVETALRRGGYHLDNSQPPRESEDERQVAQRAEEHVTKRAAVLVALFEEDGETRVILTRRSFSLVNHRGEVAFPGGRLEPGESGLDAALREANEEVGLSPSLVRPAGWLSPLATFRSGSSIQPFIGFLEARPTLRPSPREVDRVFDVSLAALLDEQNFVEERWHRDSLRQPEADGAFAICFFRVPGDLIWGATARILVELLCVVTGTTWTLSMPVPRD